MRIVQIFAILMALGYAAIVMLLPAPTSSAASGDSKSSAELLSQQAQALGNR